MDVLLDYFLLALKYVIYTMGGILLLMPVLAFVWFILLSIRRRLGRKG